MDMQGSFHQETMTQFAEREKQDFSLLDQACELFPEQSVDLGAVLQSSHRPLSLSAEVSEGYRGCLQSLW